MVASPRIDLQLQIVEVVFADVALAPLDEQNAGIRELCS